jgi:hypothetical protein
MGKGRKRYGIVAAVLCACALTVPASALAEGRITLCLKGKQACAGSNRTDVPPQIADAVAPLVVGRDGQTADHLWTALGVCSGVAPQVCEYDGHWSIGDSHTIRLAGLGRVTCTKPRPAPDGSASYRVCEAAVGSAGPYVLIEEDRNWPYPITLP